MSDMETGLSVRPPTAVGFRLLPTSLGEAMEMAKLISGSDLCPKTYKGKAAECIVAYEYGAALGLSWLQALRYVSVINGQGSLWGDAVPALILGSRECERLHEYFEGTPFEDSYTAVCVMRRKGFPDEVKRTFSVADAKRAGLWGKQGPWTQYTARMLQMRARGFCARDAFSDKLSGLILAEEAQDYYPAGDDPNTIEATATRVEDVPDPMLQIPEGMREKVGKGFEALNMGAGPRMAKIGEFMGADAKGTPDEKATALLDWLRDEYARRKTGQPRKSSNNAKAVTGPVAAPEAPAASKGTAQNPAGATGENRPATPAAAEMPQAPVAAEIFKGGAVERPQVDAVEF